MCQEVFRIVQKMNLKNVETQLALQCAPLITGIKVSNLLMLDEELEDAVPVLLHHSKLHYFRLASINGKTAFLVFRRAPLERQLRNPDVLNLLIQMGYTDLRFGGILKHFQERYEKYAREMNGDFPHEIGLILGYAIEDVQGFIEHNGKDYLYSGYWKVYEDIAVKKYIFKQYEEAKDEVILLLHHEMDIRTIIEIYSEEDNRLVI